MSDSIVNFRADALAEAAKRMNKLGKFVHDNAGCPAIESQIASVTAAMIAERNAILEKLEA